MRWAECHVNQVSLSFLKLSGCNVTNKILKIDANPKAWQLYKYQTKIDVFSFILRILERIFSKPNQEKWHNFLYQ